MVYEPLPSEPSMEAIGPSPQTAQGAMRLCPCGAKVPAPRQRCDVCRDLRIGREKQRKRGLNKSHNTSNEILRIRREIAAEVLEELSEKLFKVHRH